jgi:hypothetical protein
MIETPSPVAFLDASVFYPALLRNMLMHFAVNDLYQPRWSTRVHEEWMSALLRNRTDIPRAQIERTRDLMVSQIDDAPIEGYEGYEHRIASLTLPDAGDRYVLAAAIHCEAQFIVTANLRDFPDSALAPFGLIAEHPDAFLLRLLSDNKEQAVAAFYELCGNRKNPPQTPREVVEILKRQGLPATAGALETFIEA